MIPDYHIHTGFCGHAEGDPRDVVERAIALGMPEVGFSDHLPLPPGFPPARQYADLAMARDDLDRYVSVVHDLAREYRHDIRVLCGVEADYIETALEHTAALVDGYRFDYVIGSVHFLGDGLAYDHGSVRDRLADYGVDRVYLESLALVARAVATGLFQVIGHLDLAKKFGHRPVDREAVDEAAAAALRAIAAADVALELNTAGWRKPVGEAYPAPDLLAAAAAHGIRLTFGSDAHRPEEVGAGFDRAVRLARECGYERVSSPVGGEWPLPAGPPPADGSRAEDAA